MIACSSHRVRRGSRRPLSGAGLVALTLGLTLVVALLLSTSGAERAVAAGDAPLATVDAAFRARVDEDGLPGGVLVIAPADAAVHRYAVGDVRRTTVMPIASASKWLTAATLMTFVDEGRIALDDPVARYVPSFAGNKARVTLRMLLSHTTGLSANGCSPGDATLLDCATSIGDGAAPTSTPGTRFEYSSVGFLVAGGVIEHLSGRSFDRTFRDRIAVPLGMRHTRFGSSVTGGSPDPAASAVSTADDYVRFLRMLVGGGTVGGRALLQPTSVAEIERDQVVGIDTTSDSAVRITGITTYGLGVWRDRVGVDDAIEVVSGSGAFGFYPWIDRRHGSYGLVGVADLSSGPTHAVPASERIARASWESAEPR